MSSRKSFLAGIGMSLAIGFSLLMVSGAVKPKTQNYYEHMSSQNATNVTCSADGSTVYIADGTRVMRSRNYGIDWEIVMTKMKWETNQE